MSDHPRIRACAEPRLAEGKQRGEIRRCLEWGISRQSFRSLSRIMA